MIKKILNLKGINYWYLASAIALNLFWTIAIALFLSTLLLKQVQDSTGLMPVILLLATFLGPFMIGWVVGNMAADLRGPTYGVYGSLGGAVILLAVASSTGSMGFILAIVAIAGGLNGGMVSLRRGLRD